MSSQGARSYRWVFLGALSIASLPSGAALAAEYFVAPGGADTNTGTQAGPWLTFAYAVPRLRPGDVLTLLDGPYTSGTTGLLKADCSAGASQGLPFAPITVRAANERQAWLNPGGLAVGLEVHRCSYWSFQGLRLTGGDTSGGSDTVAVASESDHLGFSRLLVSRDNRYRNSALFVVDSSSQVELEECEFLDFHNVGLVLYRSHECSVRRCFFNSRDRPDLDGGFATVDVTRGDVAVMMEAESSGHTVENCISEGQQTGFIGSSGPWQQGARLLGSISLGEWQAAHFYSSRGSSQRALPLGTLIRDFAAVDASDRPVFLRSNIGTSVDHCTFLGTRDGLVTDLEPSNAGDGFASTFVSDSFAVGDAGYGFAFSGLGAWDGRNLSSWGFPTPYDPPSGNYTQALQMDPALGACRVYLPPSSPLKGLGTGGSDLGASILTRYLRGEDTGLPLWDPDGGAFPCGATISGVNDLPGRSCRDVNQRLEVGTAGCPLPAGYGQPRPPFDAGSPPAGNTFYIAPSGNDGAAGSRAAPWKTFGFATGQLRPSDTLVLLDGVYTPAANGRLAVNCNGSASSGLPGRPITVRADNERRARLQGNGAFSELAVDYCSDWSFEGLYVTGADSAGSPDNSTVSVFSSVRIRFAKMLVATDNRYPNGILLLVQLSTAVTVEDSEFYDFHWVGVLLYQSTGCALRRLYLHSRGRPDVAGGWSSVSPGGDYGIDLYDWDVGNVIEDCISEQSVNGFDIQTLNGVVGNTIVGSVALGGWNGLRLFNEATEAPLMAYGNRVVDFVALDQSVAGLNLEGPRSLSCERCTLYGAPVAVSTQPPSYAGSGYHAATLVDSLAVAGDGGGPVAFDLQQLVASSVAYSDSWGFGVSIVPDAGVRLANRVQDPGLGACRVFLPTTSPMRGQGSDGGDVGASVLYRHQNGVQTWEPLWDPDSGAFPCGAVVAGVNDVPDASCFDVHLRLRVGTAGCNLPPLGPPATDAGASDGGDGGTSDGGGDAGSTDGGDAGTSDGGGDAGSTDGGDAGPTDGGDDAGAADGGDAGPSDGGEDAGAADGGVEPRADGGTDAGSSGADRGHLRVGCDCSSTGPASLLPLLALLIRRAHSRCHRRQRRLDGTRKVT